MDAMDLNLSASRVPRATLLALDAVSHAPVARRLSLARATERKAYSLRIEIASLDIFRILMLQDRAPSGVHVKLRRIQLPGRTQTISSSGVMMVVSPEVDLQTLAEFVWESFSGSKRQLLINRAIVLVNKERIESALHGLAG